MELKPKEERGGQKAGLLLNITEREGQREREAGNGREERDYNKYLREAEPHSVTHF